MASANKVHVLEKKLHNENQRILKLMTGLSVLLILLVILCTMLGEARIPFVDVWRIIIGKITMNDGLLEGLSQGTVAIVWNIRLPRILTGVLVGAGLAMAGGVFQGLLMNPLADPYTIGVSTGAALGATIAIYVSSILQIAQVAVLPAAFAGAIATLFLVLKIAGKSHTLSSSSLVLTGIIISSICSAAISFIKNAAGDEVSIIVFWLMGSLASRTWSHVLILIPVIAVGGLIVRHYGTELDILCTGEDNARIYGVDVKQVRKILLITASLITAACVAVSGIIGFVGLVVPHLVREGVTARHKALLGLSALLGGLMLMLADNIARGILGIHMPVGVLTTLIGGPFFIYLFMKRHMSTGRYF